MNLSEIKLLVFDFDGVMTDNRVLVDENGIESVFCHRGDGLGLSMLKKAGLEMMVISTEANKVVSSRCKKLGLPCLQSCEDKLSALKSIAQEKGLKPNDIAFMGNDVNDLDCMQWVSHPITVADAVEDILSIAKLTTRKPGGNGAVRELADLLLKGT